MTRSSRTAPCKYQWRPVIVNAPCPLQGPRGLFDNLTRVVRNFGDKFGKQIFPLFWPLEPWKICSNRYQALKIPEEVDSSTRLRKTMLVVIFLNSLP